MGTISYISSIPVSVKKRRTRLICAPFTAVPPFQIHRFPLFLTLGHSGLLYLYEHNISTNLNDIPPGNDQISATSKEPHKPCIPGHNDCINNSAAQIELQITDLPEPLAVDNVNDILGLKIRDFHFFACAY